MQIREYSLPPGWYPREPSEISKFLAEFKRDSSLNIGKSQAARAAVSPHAGWYYSGRIAARGAACLDTQAETIAILGGHLPSGYPPLFAMEDTVRTPFAPMRIDDELRSVLKNELNGEEDRFRDNTVEVLVPMVRFFFPKAALLWLRLPAEISSFKAGKTIALAAAKLNRKINVLASTDLTHYGTNYGFSPRGGGREALRWVREVNDANFIKAVESGKSEDVLLCAERDSSSCSAGAVLGAMGFAEEAGLGGAHLLEYATSADAGNKTEASVDIPDSFVGYAAFSFGGTE
jgi:AmmeMemoRadiSam system protein B